MKDGKIISGIFLLFGGFYVLLQKIIGALPIGLAMMAVGLYLIISNIK